jgi:hypothetical protein
MPLIFVTPQLCFILKLMEFKIGWKPKSAKTKLGGKGLDQCCMGMSFYT